MNRRDFLLLRAGRAGGLDLCCEQLYMRYVDAEAEGTTGQLFEALSRELARARTVRLTDVEWLAHDGLRAAVDGALTPFVRRGGRVVRADSARARTTRSASQAPRPAAERRAR